MLNTSVEAICYKVRALRDGTFPLMLRLTQNRKRKYLSLGMSVEERFWDFKKNTPKRNCPDRDAILAVIERKSKQYREQILSCGINLTDMARIRYCDIFEGRLSYYRQKTGKLISFQLQPLALEIIDKYRKTDARQEDYVFPILDRRTHKTETQKRDRIHKAMKATNHALKRIGEKLDIPISLTTYVARHSYATVLKRSGVSTAIISESLGHSSEKVTQIYLNSFENSQIDEAMKDLL